MFNLLRTRLNQGKQYVPDPYRAQLKDFRGLPVIDPAGACPESCTACVDACPAQAITASPLSLDLGRCVFCTECAIACPEGKITFTPEFRMAASRREDLFVTAGSRLSPVAVSAEIKRIFGRSLKLRVVSAGGCNACELEVNATTNVNFDIGRYGIDVVASPRHADALVLTGPLTAHMAAAVSDAYQGIPEPRFVIAVGACAISGGLYREAPGVDRAFLDRFKPSLYVPGCPPHPLTFIAGILDLVGRS